MTNTKPVSQQLRDHFADGKPHVITYDQYINDLLPVAEATERELTRTLKENETLFAANQGLGERNLVLEQELGKAREVMGDIVKLIDDQDLVRNTDEDYNTVEFTRQSLKLVQVLKKAVDLRDGVKA